MYTVNARHPLVDLRKFAERKVTSDMTGRESPTPEEARLLLHELRVHQIELEMQNEELRRAQIEIETSHERYFDLFDLAPIGYVTVNANGFIQEVNLTAANLLGVGRGALIKQLFTLFIFKDDQNSYYLYSKQLLNTAMPCVCELRMTRQNGAQFWAHLRALSIIGADGGYLCRIVISDITERKLKDDALLRSSERNAILLQEIHHRVKNNLSLIIGLLNLQENVLTKSRRKLGTH